MSWEKKHVRVLGNSKCVSKVGFSWHPFFYLSRSRVGLAEQAGCLGPSILTYELPHPLPPRYPVRPFTPTTQVLKKEVPVLHRKLLAVLPLGSLGNPAPRPWGFAIQTRPKIDLP